MPYDPPIPHQGIYPNKTLFQEGTFTFMFIATQFIVTKTWKQSKCPSTDKWIKKMWYTKKQNSAIKKNEIMPFAATWMKLEIIILSEVKKRETNTVWYHLNEESRIWHKPIYETETISAVAKGEAVGGGSKWKVGVSRCNLLYMWQINNKVLLNSIENYIQYLMINYNGK